MSDYVEQNRALWTEWSRIYTDAGAERAWAEPEINWGVFRAPEQRLNALADVRDLDVIELGCGTAYFSSWLVRRGARAVGVDLSAAQLATARRCQDRFGLPFPLLEANAERVPLPAASFDLAVSEYGACLWCEPARWLPEAARLLRPGGRLVFLTTSALLSLCLPDDDREYAEAKLVRSAAEARRLQLADGGVEFHPSHSEWFASLRASGFQVEQLHELYAPAEAEDVEKYYQLARVEWAQQWPIEELWVARKL